jgi:hypothetical protein
LLSYRWEESTSGPPRKYYGLTEIGQTFLNELNSTWTELSDAVNLITNQNNNMNKTVNINLGGMFFHIERCIPKLTRYFDAIKRSLSKSSGQVIKISNACCGTFNGKSKTDKQVVFKRR